MGKDYDVKIADFGISQVLTKNYSFIHDAVGSLIYCSPELLSGQPFNQKTDVWALGCILYEMLSNKKCFEGGTEQHVKKNIVDRRIPKIHLADEQN